MGECQFVRFGEESGKRGRTESQTHPGLEARRGRAVTAALPGAVADLLGVDGAGDAVLHLEVQLGEGVL